MSLFILYILFILLSLLLFIIIIIYFVNRDIRYTIHVISLSLSIYIYICIYIYIHISISISISLSLSLSIHIYVYIYIYMTKHEIPHTKKTNRRHRRGARSGRGASKSHFKESNFLVLKYYFIMYLCSYFLFCLKQHYCFLLLLLSSLLLCLMIASLTSRRSHPISARRLERGPPRCDPCR